MSTSTSTITTTASTTRDLVLQYSVSWIKSQREYLQVERRALCAFRNAFSDSVDHLRDELLFVAMVLAQHDTTPRLWEQMQSTIRDRALYFARMPWFAALLCGVAFVMQKRPLLSSKLDESSTITDSVIRNSSHEFLAASDQIPMRAVSAVVDVVDPDNSRILTLRNLLSAFAVRVTKPTDRIKEIQQLLTTMQEKTNRRSRRATMPTGDLLPTVEKDSVNTTNSKRRRRLASGLEAITSSALQTNTMTATTRQRRRTSEAASVDSKRQLAVEALQELSSGVSSPYRPPSIEIDVAAPATSTVTCAATTTTTTTTTIKSMSIEKGW
jgi:hypothetical protein